MSLELFAHAAARFKASGRPRNNDVPHTLQTQIGDRPVRNLLVLCHGWNNNEAEAAGLYEQLLAQMLQVNAQHGDGQLTQSLAVVPAFWPSKQFDLGGQSTGPAGGAAALPGTSGTEARLIGALESLREPQIDDAAIDDAIALVPKLEDLRSAQDAFVALLLPLLQQEADEEDEPDRDDSADADHSAADAAAGDEPPPMLASLTGREVLDRLGRPLPAALLQPRAGEPEGGAAGAVGRGVQGGALTFVNLLTFWKMKKRAGKVGARGLHPLLRELQQRLPELHIHLAGHSFGARALTAAVAAGDTLAAPQRPVIRSLSLVQGAFSHNSFAENFHQGQDGAFRNVMTGSLVQGPVLATHTRNDMAVSLAYPLASRLSRDDANAIGDASDRFGGIGSNGAVHTPEALSETLLPAGSSYELLPGRIHNLRADAHISGHSDVTGPAVAAALLAAMQE